jgi:hypothetical protein
MVQSGSGMAGSRGWSNALWFSLSPFSAMVSCLGFPFYSNMDASFPFCQKVLPHHCNSGSQGRKGLAGCCVCPCTRNVFIGQAWVEKKSPLEALVLEQGRRAARWTQALKPLLSNAGMVGKPRVLLSGSAHPPVCQDGPGLSISSHPFLPLSGRYHCCPLCLE